MELAGPPTGLCGGGAMPAQGGGGKGPERNREGGGRARVPYPEELGTFEGGNRAARRRDARQTPGRAGREPPPVRCGAGPALNVGGGGGR